MRVSVILKRKSFSRLKSDFAQVIDDFLENRTVELKWQQEGYNVGVVVAAAGYPEDYETGMVLPDFSAEELSVYYAGVRIKKTAN